MSYKSFSTKQDSIEKTDQGDGPKKPTSVAGQAPAPKPSEAKQPEKPPAKKD
ncbi:MAG: hypothetical protein RIC29_16765 [Rhodospirillaceae bacterium]